MPAAFVTIAELEQRHPRELVTLSADETTGLRVDARIEAAIADAGAEIRGILLARYQPADFERLDADSRDILRRYAVDIVLWRLATSTARTTDALKERYEQTIKLLQAIATGKGGLSFDADGSSGPGAAGGASIAPFQPVLIAPERVFTRERTKGL